MSGTQPLSFVPTLPPEEAARAALYGLLARLFYAPPDAALLASIAASGSLEAEQGELAPAWAELAEAARSADPEAVREEYELQFVGTGKAPVTLYASAYLIRYSSETPLAELRGQLAAMGIARRSNVHEPEDHIAALCDVMRFLIAEQKTEPAQQRPFFERWIGPTAERLCAAIEKAPGTVFYRRVAKVARSFFALEQSGFEML
jgi:TorA maturation chaperone TorD